MFIVLGVLTLQVGMCHTDDCEMPHAAENKALFIRLFFSDITRVALSVLWRRRVAQVRSSDAARDAVSHQEGEIFSVLEQEVIRTSFAHC